MGEPSTRGAKFARHETKGTEYRAKLAREFEKMVFSKEPSADDRAAAWLERENARILNKENEP